MILQSPKRKSKKKSEGLPAFLGVTPDEDATPDSRTGLLEPLPLGGGRDALADQTVEKDRPFRLHDQLSLPFFPQKNQSWLLEGRRDCIAPPPPPSPWAVGVLGAGGGDTTAAIAAVDPIYLDVEPAEVGTACKYNNKAPLAEIIEFFSPNKSGAKLSTLDACKQGAWSIAMLNTRTEKITVRPFKCHSWRHEGACRDWKGAQDFVRIKEALNGAPGGLTYMVLTFARKDSPGDDVKHWESRQKAYRGLYACWDKLRKRFSREWGKFRYISLVEQHADGWPHLNVIVENDAFRLSCEGDGSKLVEEEWLKRHAKECGFGYVMHLKPVWSADVLAGYFVKLCSGKIGAEIAKTTQAPIAAPAGFRRLRASHGFLPKPFKNPDVTGLLSSTEATIITDGWKGLTLEEKALVRRLLEQSKPALANAKKFQQSKRERLAVLIEQGIEREVERERSEWKLRARLGVTVTKQASRAYGVEKSSSGTVLKTIGGANDLT